MNSGNGSVVVSGGSTYIWKLSDQTGASAAGSGWDLAVVSGFSSDSLDLSGLSPSNQANITIQRLGTAVTNAASAATTFEIADAGNIILPTGGLTTSDFAISDSTASVGNNWTVMTEPDGSGGTELVLIAGSPTPEPGSLGLIGVASLGLLRRRRTVRSA